MLRRAATHAIGMVWEGNNCASSTLADAFAPLG
jgi:hypothetical protein